MPRHQIVCIKKDSNGTITHYGVLITKEDAVQLVAGGFELDTLLDGEPVPVEIVERDGVPYLRSPKDESKADNLGTLPDCACGQSPFDDFLQDKLPR